MGYYLHGRVYFIGLLLAWLHVPCCDTHGLHGLHNNKALFWKTSGKKGANIFNKIVDNTVIIAAKQYDIDFIRLAPDKFPTKERDFLIGDAENYKGLATEDLAALKNLLDSFQQQNIPVVLTMLSLPGSRWKQNNNFTDDLRLWTSEDFQNQASKFWKDVAMELKDHPAIVGYNILNEPHLDKLFNSSTGINGSIENQDAHQTQTALFTCYSKIIESIRQVDPVTPIILESSGYADPKNFERLQPVNDTNVIYSFHMYEPYIYKTKKLNQGRFSYPGYIPSWSDENKLEFWDKAMLRSYMEPVRKFQEKYLISNDKILVGEFGGHRTSKGLEFYLQDLIDIFNEYRWHWSVYAFREDTWDGMDYELGSKGYSWTEWQAIQNGTLEKKYLPDNTIFKVLKREWAQKLNSSLQLFQKSRLIKVK